MVRAEDGAGNEESNIVTRSGYLKVQEEPGILADSWWIISAIVIILQFAVIALLALRTRKEPAKKTIKEPEVEEEEIEEGR